MTGRPKPLKQTSIPGFLSAEQIAPHHTAPYGGALKGYMAADARIEEAVKEGQSLDSAAYGALKRAVNSKGNSVVLHEMYFDGLAPEALDPAADARKAIEDRFGSMEKWAGDFIRVQVREFLRQSMTTLRFTLPASSGESEATTGYSVARFSCGTTNCRSCTRPEQVADRETHG